MIATRREPARLPWSHALTSFACTVHAAAVLIYAAVFFGLTNTELRWNGVEQLPRWYLIVLAAGVAVSHAAVAFGPLLPAGWRTSVAVRAIRATVAVVCGLSLLFAALMLPFAVFAGASWEGWALMLALGMSAAIVLASLVRAER